MKAGAITSPSSLFQISLLSLLLSGGMVPLNAQWSGQDVGAPSPAGSWSVSSGAYTVNGSGADIWGAADQFQFVWQAITGDVTVTARVTAQQNTNAWAKAGVMIREDLSAGSRHAMTAVTPGNGTAFQNRAATNGTSLHTASSGTVPVWVRISRTGNTLTSYRSTDGFSWTTIGSATITMASTVYAGLCVTSHSSGVLCQATFTNVTVAGSNLVTLTVSSSGNGSTSPSGTLTVKRDTTVSVTATPASGWLFDGWSGDASGTTNPLAILMNGNKTVTANYRDPNAPPVTGITREWWTGISGSSVADLTGNPNYPNSPSGRDTLKTLVEAPANWADNYGTRLRGYVHPPATGPYVFWISSDDASELWLSTDAGTANKQLVARVSGWTNSREWTKYPEQQSAAITLTAGRKYYVEALQKEGGGGDHLAIGWQLPGGTQERPIPQSRVSPYSPYTAPRCSLLVGAAANGTVTPSGWVTVDSGAATAVSAAPSAGHRFSQWTVVSGGAIFADPNAASTQVTLTTGDAAIRCVTAPVTVSLTLSAATGGSVSPARIDTLEMLPVTITATPQTGYKFSYWEIDAASGCGSNAVLFANATAAVTQVRIAVSGCAIRAVFAEDVTVPNSRKLAISGELYDTLGTVIGYPAPDTIDMTVRLTDDAVSGDTVYTERFLRVNAQGIVVDNGLFTVRLGEGAAQGDLAAAVAANASLWAEITVEGPQPDVLLPRTPLTAAPYSLRQPGTQVLHGNGAPDANGTAGVLGQYYVDDATGQTWVRLNSNWRLLD